MKTDSVKYPSPIEYWTGVLDPPVAWIEMEPSKGPSQLACLVALGIATKATIIRTIN